MALFYITFDLAQHKDYPKLWSRLEEYQAKRVLLTVWAPKGKCTSMELRDDLSQYVDQNVRLLVVESKKAAWFGPLLFDPKEI